MFGTQNLGLFISAGLLLNVTPGQDTLYIVGRSLAQGRRAGVVSALGISTGSLVHTVVAAAGLAALLAASPTAFEVIRWAGAAYLAYLGVRMILSRTPATGPAGVAGENGGAARGRRGLLRVYAQGVLTNVLNPKVSLFFLAFLPQFVDPAAESKPAAMLFLGAVFTFNGTLWCLVLAVLAAEMNRRIRRSAAAAGRMNQLVGALFVGLGVRLAVSR
jgi:threonine/homoserine/homoserine lactone efflux protein